MIIDHGQSTFIAASIMQLLKDFFAASWKTIFSSRAEQELSKKPLDDDQQTGRGMASLRSGESTVCTPPSSSSPLGAQALDRVSRLGTERPTRGVRLHSAERETKLF